MAKNITNPKAPVRKADNTIHPLIKYNIKHDTKNKAIGNLYTFITIFAGTFSYKIASVIKADINIEPINMYNAHNTPTAVFIFGVVIIKYTINNKIIVTHNKFLKIYFTIFCIKKLKIK